MSKFSEEIKRLRESKGITQEKFAKAIGVSRSAVGMYEQGQREPSFEIMERIADFFNVPMGSLVDDNVVDSKRVWYINEETAKIAQEIFENPELRVLFSASRDASPEDLLYVSDLLLKLKRAESR